jgi:hypothetical protein
MHALQREDRWGENAEPVAGEWSGWMNVIVEFRSWDPWETRRAAALSGGHAHVAAAQTV